jgi:hypothetical protein
MSTYRTNDDELLRAIRERVDALNDAIDCSGERSPPASSEELSWTESELGFPLPPLLREVYRVVNGGIGPSNGLLPVGQGSGTISDVYRSFADSKYTPEPGEPSLAKWPWALVPICEWGDAIWSCLDFGSNDGPIVTAASWELANTGHTLRSWLRAWLDGGDLFEEMFEPQLGVNPFTGRTMVVRGVGKPKGTKWP